MANYVLHRAWTWIHKTFPERQIYIRGEGRVQFFTLSVTLQATICGLALVFFGWVAFATVTIVFKDRIIAAKDYRYQQLQSSYENQVAEREISYDELNSALVATENRARAAVFRMQNRQNAVARDIEMKQNNHQHLETDDDSLADSQLPEIELRHDANPIVEDADLHLFQMPAPTAPKPRNSRFVDTMTSIGNVITPIWRALTVRRTQSNSAKALAQHPALRALARDTAQLQQLDAQSVPLMERTNDSLAEGVDDIRRRIARTGINPEQLTMEISGVEGVGGPEIPLENVRLEGISDLRFTRAYLKAQAVITQLFSLSSALSHIPIAIPVRVQGIHQTSGFGPRLDPFTGSYAFHPGIDFAGPTGAPVLATAPGTVTFAGSNGSYGNMVEIDHGYGLHSRYAHLLAVTVRTGARVTKGAIVGRLGSTGRSTGPHVHYEVWYNNVVRNPQQFINAGR